MKNVEKADIPVEEKRKNMISNLAVGAALGVVFASGLDGLLPTPLDLIAGLAFGLLVGYSLGKRPFMTMRYPAFVVRRLLFALSAFVIGMFAFRYCLELGLNSREEMLSALLAIIPAILFVLAIGSAIAHLDEMQRRIQTESIAIAFAGTSIFVIVHVLLSFAGVSTPHWGWLLFVMTFTWVLGKLWTMWRYR